MAISFTIAGPADEAEIRRILRENPLGGGWQISLEREPDGLGGPHVPDERQVLVLARDPESGVAIGLCERLVRPAWVNGERRMMPYLGALRIAPSHRHRLAILRGGFATLREQAELPDECGFALTSIAADNHVAKRLLTAGLKGLPHYRPVGPYLTAMMRARHYAPDPAIAPAAPADLPEIADWLARVCAKRQFSPALDAATLAAQTGLELLVMRGRGEITGLVGLWDQRASRQAVIHAMPQAARWLRCPANLLAPLTGLPEIPATGRRIEQAFITMLATDGDESLFDLRLVRAALSLAASKQIKVGTLGLPGDHPWRQHLLRCFRRIEYRTDLYAVHWPETEPEIDMAGQTVFPDVALL